MFLTLVLEYVFCSALFSTLQIRQVCYGDLGCFSNAPPFNNANNSLPQSPDFMDVRFLMYTRDNPEVQQLLDPYDVTTITSSNYGGSKLTYFIIHGYLGNAQSDFLLEMKTALLVKEDCNVILVDWAKGASAPINEVAQVAANTRVVGSVLWKMMDRLIATGPTTYSQMTLIGYSYGAHVAGYAGTYASGQVGRIFGLDAGRPFFEGENPLVRLDPSDAVYVEGIHTNAGVFGMIQPVGHADFYPNGGAHQPECNPLSNLLEFCSHRRSVFLFTESITSGCLFTGKPCNSKNEFDAGQCNTCKSGCTDMGLNGVIKKSGTFYLKTFGSIPFCIE